MKPKFDKDTVARLAGFNIVDAKEAIESEQTHFQQDLASSMYHRQTTDVYMPYNCGNWTGD